MNFTRLKSMAMVSALALMVAAPHSTNAQTTETVPASVTAQNGFTVAIVNGLLFGTVGFFLDGTNDVAYVLDAADGETFTPVGGTSSMVSIVGGQSAELTVQGPIDTDISMVIPTAGVVNLTDGATPWVLDSFVYNDQSAVPNSGIVALDTPVIVTLDAANTDENVLIGATITADGTATYADGPYTGSFNVTFQY